MPFDVTIITFHPSFSIFKLDQVSNSGLMNVPSVELNDGFPMYSTFENSICKLKIIIFEFNFFLHVSFFKNLELEVVYLTVKLFYIIEIIICPWHVILNRSNFHSLRKEQLFAFDLV